MTGLIVGIIGLTIASIIHSFSIFRMESKIMELQVNIIQLESKQEANDIDKKHL